MSDYFDAILTADWNDPAQIAECRHRAMIAMMPDLYSTAIDLEYWKGEAARLRTVEAERDELKDHEEACSDWVCTLWNALGTKDKVFEQEHALERIRDLIAIEGELGDLKESHATLLRESLEVMGPFAKAAGPGYSRIGHEHLRAARRFVEKHGGGK